MSAGALSSETQTTWTHAFIGGVTVRTQATCPSRRFCCRTYVLAADPRDLLQTIELSKTARGKAKLALRYSTHTAIVRATVSSVGDFSSSLHANAVLANARQLVEYQYEQSLAGWNQ